MSLWTCSVCGRSFANRNQSHTCRALGALDRHFEGKDPGVRKTFDRLLVRGQPFSTIARACTEAGPLQ
jgi:transposase-like protein